MMTHDIFISYSSKQKSIADGVCHYLEENGFKCWMAPRDIPIGTEYGDLIEESIRSSKAVVLVFSEAASMSKWVKGEINVAFSEGKPILPFRVDGTEIMGGFRVMLNQMHWIDAFPQYADRLPDLLDAVCRILGRQGYEQTARKESKPKKSIFKWVALAIAVAAVVAATLLLRLFSPPRLGSTGSADGHEFVDLGLPSGTLWATCNVGASIPEDGGSFFAWGETETKTTFNWSSYKYSKGDVDQLTKYCTNPNHGSHGFADSLLTLQPSDDAATVNWGDRWSIPTEKQWKELYQNTTNQWTERNGVKGRLFTSINGQSLFLPAAGFRWENELCSSGDVCYCWSSTLYADTLDNACSFGFNSEYYRLFGVFRSSGRSVRAVYIGIH